jgi:hypothetical protein
MQRHKDMQQCVASAMMAAAQERALAGSKAEQRHTSAESRSTEAQRFKTADAMEASAAAHKGSEVKQRHGAVGEPDSQILRLKSCVVHSC